MLQSSFSTLRGSPRSSRGGGISSPDTTSFSVRAASGFFGRRKSGRAVVEDKETSTTTLGTKAPSRAKATGRRKKRREGVVGGSPSAHARAHASSSSLRIIPRESSRRLASLFKVTRVVGGRRERGAYGRGLGLPVASVVEGRKTRRDEGRGREAPSRAFSFSRARP